ncbi:MAG: polyprenyl synthetase family protein [Geothrix sp.]|nr:polyprenyl synthetase family protein [Geothrix sp.]
MSGAATQVQGDLDRLLPMLDTALARSFRNGEAARLGEAARYSLEAGGKRVRPVLCLLACEAVGGSAEMALPGALALEYVHTYSLIHDDLPAMDDDDLRRGRPTNHKVFGEGHAILAGDALLTEAFGVLASADLEPARRAEALTLLAEGAGWRGMAGGQALDLEAEARAKAHRLAKRDGPKGEAQGGSASTRAASGKALQEERLSGGGPSEGEQLDAYDLDHLRLIHRLKTGALLRASLEIGAVLGGAASAERAALRAYGEAIGLAFQIQDDILDATATDADLGKRAGKDAGRGKITYPSLLGLEGARRALDEATETAICQLASLSNRNSLAAWARYLALRAK